jgi:membrane associated rhomboid family serine protease
VTEGQQAGVPVCYRHPDRESHIRCQRCGRPICPECMSPAPVGFQCPECVAEGRKSTRQPRTPFGGRRNGDSALVSRVLIGINAAVWLLILATGGNGSAVLRQLWLLSQDSCGRFFAGQCVEIDPGVAGGAWWQPLTSMFTHVSILHIGFNMLALWILGPQLEAILGRWRYLSLYLLSGLAGSAMVYWFAAPNTPTVGASGAIFGLMGALLVVAFKVRGDVRTILFWIGLNFVVTVIGRGFISWQGHLGGFIGGVLLGVLLAYAPRKGRVAVQSAGMVLLAVVLAVAYAARTLMLG